MKFIQHPLQKKHFQDLLQPFRQYLEIINRLAVIQDNAAIAAIDNDIIKVCTLTEFRYLPSFLNLIENCFSVLKNYIKYCLHSEARQCTTATAHRQGLTVLKLDSALLLPPIGKDWQFWSSTVHYCNRPSAKTDSSRIKWIIVAPRSCCGPASSHDWNYFIKLCYLCSCWVMYWGLLMTKIYLIKVYVHSVLLN